MSTPKKNAVKFTEHEAKLIGSAKIFYEERFGFLTSEQIKDFTLLRRVLNYYHDRAGVEGAMHKLLDNVLEKLDKAAGETIRTPEEIAAEVAEVERQKTIEAKAIAKAEAEARIAKEQAKVEAAEKKLAEEKAKARLAEKKNVVPEKEKETLDIDSILDNI